MYYTYHSTAMDIDAKADKKVETYKHLKITELSALRF